MEQKKVGSGEFVLVEYIRVLWQCDFVIKFFLTDHELGVKIPPTSYSFPLSCTSVM